MIIQRARVLMLVGSLGIILGCDADSPTPPQLPEPEFYHEPTAPDSVLMNLILAHRRKDEDAYAALLAPEFRFFFISQDAIELGASSWDRSQDLAGTRALFAAARGIGLAAGHSDPELADPNLYPAGTVKIHLMSVRFTVEDRNNITWDVETEQDLYFRPGNPDAGEDGGHWLLLQWHELEPIGAPASGDEPTPVSPSTWGRLKYLYL